MPNDPKTLFRRCQAHEALKQVDKAYQDAREVHRVDPKNPAIEPVLVRLHKAVSEKVCIVRRYPKRFCLNYDSIFPNAVERLISDVNQSEKHV